MIIFQKKRIVFMMIAVQVPSFTVLSKISKYFSFCSLTDERMCEMILLYLFENYS